MLAMEVGQPLKGTDVVQARVYVYQHLVRLLSPEPMVAKQGFRHKAGMKLQKQATVPTIENDLSRIQQLSKERDCENREFRSFLKQYARHTR